MTPRKNKKTMLPPDWHIAGEPLGYKAEDCPRCYGEGRVTRYDANDSECYKAMCLMCNGHGYFYRFVDQ